jgi:hypothetical protein
MRLFFKHARDPVCVIRAVKVALFVGTVLCFINHFDEIIHGVLTSTNMIQIGITYMVPYSTSTFGSAMQARHIELNGRLKVKDSE